jgi:hypothetical protein
MMADLTLRELMTEAVKATVEAARGPVCDPEAVRAFAEDRALTAAQQAHIGSCVACLYDAAQLRAQRALRTPGIPFSFLLHACDALLKSPRGLRVTFADGSTATLRHEAHKDPDVEVLRLDDLTVVPGYEVRAVVLHSGAHIVLSPPASATGFRLEVDRAVLRDPAERWTLRLVKRPVAERAEAERPSTAVLRLLQPLRPQLVAAGGVRSEAGPVPAVVEEATPTPVEVRLAVATDTHGWATGWYVSALPAEAGLEAGEPFAGTTDRGDRLRCVMLDDGALFIEAPGAVLPAGTRLVLSTD